MTHDGPMDLHVMDNLGLCQDPGRNDTHVGPQRHTKRRERECESLHGGVYDGGAPAVFPVYVPQEDIIRLHHERCRIRAEP